MTDVNEPVAPARAKRRSTGRSPAYPAISLDRAVQRAGEVYRKDRQYAVPVENLAEIWGYANLNGPAASALAALIKFGLVEDEGAKAERTARVSDLAVQILNHPSSDARKEAIKEAALLPSIHREMWEQYGAQLPSDSNLLWRLTRERGFTDTGAKEFIREWRDTMEFAGLTSDDASAAHTEEPEGPIEVDDPDVAEETGTRSPGMMNSFNEFMDKFDPNTRAVRNAPTASPRAPQTHNVSGTVPVVSATSGLVDFVQNYPIPIALKGRPPVVISGAFPLSEAEWAQFKAVLEAMKPVLVGDPPVAEPEPDSSI